MNSGPSDSRRCPDRTLALYAGFPVPSASEMATPWRRVGMLRCYTDGGDIQEPTDLNQISQTRRPTGARGLPLAESITGGRDVCGRPSVGSQSFSMATRELSPQINLIIRGLSRLRDLSVSGSGLIKADWHVVRAVRAEEWTQPLGFGDFAWGGRPTWRYCRRLPLKHAIVYPARD